MQYKYLGKTGVKISELCFGTMTFGKEADKAESQKIFNRCLDVGINIFDCANVYNNGLSEEFLGEFIKDYRNHLIITTKFSSKVGEGVNESGNSRLHLMQAVENSLKRLKTSWIDIYFIHRFDPFADMKILLKTLDSLVKQGKVRYLGVSNWAAWQIMKALGISQWKNLEAFSCVQPMYNLLKRQAEVEILPMAQSEGLGVLSYSPIAAGVLTGKYLSKQLHDQTRLSDKAYYAARYSAPHYSQITKEFTALAKEAGVSPVLLALKWVRKNPAITAPIIGARNLEQLEVSLSSIDHPLDQELYEKISTLTPRPPLATDRLEEQV